MNDGWLVIILLLVVFPLLGTAALLAGCKLGERYGDNIANFLKRLW